MDHGSLKQLPKVLLHDHLDGGLRVDTVLDLADEQGYRGLPASEAKELRDWFHQGRSGSLERYLEAFEHTVAVMQTADAIRRVAYEAGVDLAADGVVYAEVRFGPSLHTEGDLTREDAIEAVLDGLAAASTETGIALYGIAAALRQEDDSEDVVQAAIPFLERGLVGFDLAGPEAGFPADDHLAACLVARRAGLGLTIHGGEGDGPHSMWRALAICGAQRIGHGVRIIEETIVEGGEIIELAPLARRIRDHRVPLENSPTSNLHTGAYVGAGAHPFGSLYRAGFAVTLNTDNRLMSDVTLTDEFAFATNDQGLSVPDLGVVTENALRAAFGDWTVRRDLLENVVRPAYAAMSGSTATSQA